MSSPEIVDHNVLYQMTIGKVMSVIGRVGLGLGMVGAPIAATEYIDPAPVYASAVNPEATVGMPFAGKWAYNAIVQPDSKGNYSDATSSHPSVHQRYYGDWATDLYDPAGTDVKLEVSSSDGTVSFSYNRSNDSCASDGLGVAGHGIVLNVLVNGTDVGSIDYEHLDNIPDPATTTFTNGMTIGNITSEPFAISSGCYTARHTHVELKNSSTTTYACWTDNGLPGTSLNEGNSIGILGSSNTGPQQECTDASDPPPPAANPMNDPQMIISGAIAYDKNGIYNPVWNSETPPTVLQVAVSPDEEMILQSDRSVWARRTDAGQNQGWTKETDPGVGTQIAISSTDVQAVLTTNNELWAQSKIVYNKWTRESTGVTAMAVGGDYQMLVNGLGAVYSRQGMGTDGWVQETDQNVGQQVAVSETGLQMVLTKWGEVWATSKIGLNMWTGETASGVDTARYVAVGGNTQLIITTDNTLYAKDTLGTSPWNRETTVGAVRSAQVSMNGLQVVIAMDYEAWAQTFIGLNYWVQEAGPNIAGFIATDQ